MVHSGCIMITFEIYVLSIRTTWYYTKSPTPYDPTMILGPVFCLGRRVTERSVQSFARRGNSKFSHPPNQRSTTWTNEHGQRRAEKQRTGGGRRVICMNPHGQAEWTREDERKKTFFSRQNQLHDAHRTLHNAPHAAALQLIVSAAVL